MAEIDEIPGMEVKFVHITDIGTAIPAIAIRLSPRNIREKDLLKRVGHNISDDKAFHSIILTRLNEGRGEVDPFNWRDRTHSYAHLWICENFDSIVSGDTVDVIQIISERSSL